MTCHFAQVPSAPPSADALRQEAKQQDLRQLRSPDPKVRGQALWELLNVLDIPAHKLLPILVTLLRPVESASSPEAEFQFYVIATLASCGPQVRPAMADLHRYATDPRLAPELVAESIKAEWAIDPRSKTLLAFCMDRVSQEPQESDDVLNAALQVIASRGREGEKAVPSLVRLLTRTTRWTTTRAQYLTFIALGMVQRPVSLPRDGRITQMFLLEEAAVFRAILAGGAQADYLIPHSSPF